ncbi:MAG: hypothetical protein OEY59_07915 [Deltaproteobacteria bacterium]|nr:hypothetical protein [Deltaproteobacteria bacterium]
MFRLRFFILFIALVFLSVGQSFALINRVEISGEFIKSQQLFKGEAVYYLDGDQGELFYFHLPPNFEAKYDTRTSYRLKGLDSKDHEVNRDALKRLKAYRHENRHLSVGIKIDRVYLNGKEIPFQQIDNPALSPLRNAQGALLRITLGELPENGPNTIRIAFQTSFHELPSNYLRILVDFIPRPVSNQMGDWDFKDQLKPPVQNFVKIRYLQNEHDRSKRIIEEKSFSGSLIVLMDPFMESNPQFRFGAGPFLFQNMGFFQHRTQQVLDFLFQRQWIRDDGDPFSFIIWDGGLMVFGKTILLPRKIFRYHFLFEKLFESYILEGVIQSSLQQNKIINSHQNPWLVPALIAEPLRDYIEQVYHGNSKIFFWTDWLNPDIFQEKTLKNWLFYKNYYQPVSASLPLDLNFYSNHYHPWYEKGFHFLRTLHDSQTAFETEFYPKLKSLIQSQDKKVSLLMPDNFFDLLGLSSNQIEAGNKWLSEGGSVDYAVEKVEIIKREHDYELILDVQSLGSVNPSVEVEIVYKNRHERRVLLGGSRKHRLIIDDNPTQIKLNPDNTLLEEDFLNNYWSVPVKIRPIWDFASTNEWLFTIFPITFGNAYDKNLLGVQLDLSYLNQTNLQLEIWKRSLDNQILFSGTLFHNGFPWKGTNLYFSGSQLNATTTYSLGVIQEYGQKEPEAWVDLFIWREYLNTDTQQTQNGKKSSWDGIEMAGNVPLIEGAFSKWEINLSLKSSRNTVVKNENYSQQSLFQRFSYDLFPYQLILSNNLDNTDGEVPDQKLFPMGGPNSMPGFPRDKELFYPQKLNFGVGTRLAPIMTHTDLNLMKILWIQKVDTYLFYHYGLGRKKDSGINDQFKDFEIRFRFFLESLNQLEGSTEIAFAKPIGHEKYKDWRIILFSDWVF